MLKANACEAGNVFPLTAALAMQVESTIIQQ